MKFRRIRTASLAELDDVLDQYSQKLQNYVKSEIEKRKKEIADNRDNISDKETRKTVKKAIIGLVNGEGDFPGLSELPELPEYGEVYDKIVGEYNDLNKNRGFFEKALGLDLREFNKYVNQTANIFDEFDKNIEDFVESLSVYGEDYPSQWYPFVNETSRISTNLFNAVIELFSKNKDLKEYVNANKMKLNKIISDFTYYKRQFENIFKNGPADSVKEPYEKANKSFAQVLDVMQEYYDKFVSFGY